MSQSLASAPGFWLTLWRVYKKDTALEWKSPVGILSSVLFALILAALYNYSMLADTFKQTANLHGIMLATLFFSSTLVSGRNIHFEKEGGALRIMLISPADAAGYYLGKVLSLWQLQTLFCVIYIPLYILLLQGRLPANPSEVLVPGVFLALAALSLSALGIMLSYISSGNRMREIILPLLLLPASLPVFMLAADAMRQTFRNGGGALDPAQILVLLAPAGIFCALGSLLYYTLAADE